MTKGTCRNCGADENIHQYETMRCPWGGYEAPIGQKERWSEQTFEEDKPSELDELKARVITLEAQVAALLDAVPSAKVQA